MTYSLKPLLPWFSNFIYSMKRLQGIRMMKFSQVENQKWPLLLKIANPLKSFFFLQNHLVHLAEILYRALVGPCSRIRSQWPTSCFCVQFCQNANISWNAEQNLVPFSRNDLQMESFQIYVTEWAVQDGCQLLSLKIAKTWKWQSQEPLNEFRPILCHQSPYMKLLQFFTIWPLKMAASSVTKNSVKRETDNISKLPSGFCQNTCHADAFIMFLMWRDKADLT